MAYFADQIFNGLSLGTVYALIALGFAIVYGVLRLLNFAHFEVFTIGTFVGYFALNLLVVYLPGTVAALVAVCLAGIAGGLAAIMVERLAYRPIRGEPKVTALVTAIAVAILMENLGITFLSAHTRGYPKVELPLSPKVVAVVVLAGTFAFTYWLVYFTDLGLKLRAVAECTDIASLMGIRPDPVITLAFFVGGAFAGSAGVVWGLVYGTVNPQMGFVPGLKAFIIAVIGGIGNLRGTFLMGVALGILEALIAGYLTSELSGFKESVVLGVLLVLLVWRPNGVFSKPEQIKV